MHSSENLRILDVNEIISRLDWKLNNYHQVFKRANYTSNPIL